MFGSFGAPELLILALIAVPFWAAWRICGKVGWSRWWVLLAAVPLVGFVFWVVLIFEALPQAGYRRWLIILSVIPLLNIVLALRLAIEQWPTPKALDILTH